MRDETSLIRDILRGRTETFADLVSPHTHFINHFVRARISNSADADEIIQETLLKAFRHLARFRGEASFRTWLYRIALNEIRQHRRSTVRSQIVYCDSDALAEMSPAGTGVSPLLRLERKEAAVSLRKAILNLPKPLCRVMVLRVFHSFHMAQIAEQLGLTEAAVKTRHFRGTQLLRQRLKYF